jgi:hypothetical protein
MSEKKIVFVLLRVKEDGESEVVGVYSTLDAADYDCQSNKYWVEEWEVRN